MKLSQYGYEFKPEMLAKYPAENRDEARLMVVNRAKGTIEHRIFNPFQILLKRIKQLFSEFSMLPLHRRLVHRPKGLPPSAQFIMKMLT